MATTSGSGLEAAVAERAYFKAEQRGFAPGFELDDWLAAERELAAAGEAPKATPPRRKPRLKSVPTSPPRAARSKSAKASGESAKE